MSTLVRVALALAGLLAVGLGFWLRHMNAQSAAWPAVSGHVVASRVGTDHDGDEAAHIKYRYQVGGQEHESDQVSYKVGSAKSRTLAADLVARYPVGKSVDVYYDPADPARAVLERGPSKAWLALVGVGVIFLAVAGLGAGAVA